MEPGFVGRWNTVLGPAPLGVAVSMLLVDGRVCWMQKNSPQTPSISQQRTMTRQPGSGDMSLFMYVTRFFFGCTIHVCVCVVFPGSDLFL